jgi:hypothetical protein
MASIRELNKFLEKGTKVVRNKTAIGLVKGEIFKLALPYLQGSANVHIIMPNGSMSCRDAFYFDLYEEPKRQCKIFKFN